MSRIPTTATTGLLMLIAASVHAGVPVTVDNFPRAESDLTFARYVRQGAFGKMFHIRMPTPIDRQDVVRMNRDTLYSAGIFDLTEPSPSSSRPLWGASSPC